MTPPWISLTLSILSTAVIVLLAVDRLVHRIIGATPPLEARVLSLEGQVNKGNARLSEKMSELTSYLEERRGEVEAIRSGLSELRGEVRVMRGYRRDEGGS